MPAIEARALRKEFVRLTRRPGIAGAVRSLVRPVRERTVAVEEVSFTVADGELVALLGPNGAGKSTTIKMLTGILTPTSGLALVGGRVPHEDRIAGARRVGAVLGQRTQLWWDLPAIESLRMLRDIYRTPAPVYRRRLADLDGLLALSEFWHCRPRQMSLGQRVRADIAAALLHDPPTVFLDEPTIGMDAVGKDRIREFLRCEVAERGRTVLLTTHDMSEVARLAERVVLVNHGRVVYDGGLAELQREYGSGWKVRAGCGDPTLAGWPGFQGRAGETVLFAGRDPGEQRRLVRALLDRDDVRDLEVHGDDLEDVMASVYRRRTAMPLVDS